jgi:hypothetical protein
VGRSEWDGEREGEGGKRKEERVYEHYGLYICMCMCVCVCGKTNMRKGRVDRVAIVPVRPTATVAATRKEETTTGPAQEICKERRR